MVTSGYPSIDYYWTALMASVKKAPISPTGQTTRSAILLGYSNMDDGAAQGLVNRSVTLMPLKITVYERGINLETGPIR